MKQLEKPNKNLFSLRDILHTVFTFKLYIIRWAEKSQVGLRTSFSQEFGGCANSYKFFPYSKHAGDG